MLHRRTPPSRRRETAVAAAAVLTAAFSQLGAAPARAEPSATPLNLALSRVPSASSVELDRGSSAASQNNDGDTGTAVQSLGLVPKPVSVTGTDGPGYRLDPSTTITAVGAGAKAPAAYLAQVLRPATGYRLPIVSARTGHKPIIVKVRSGLGPTGHPEGYELTVNPAKITIEASTAAGALNGVQTLRQLFPQWVESPAKIRTAWTVPQVRITDYPRFAHRGMMLDVARSFYPVDEVEKYIDAAAQFKINRLHLHLSDDQGWRIAIDSPSDNPSGIDYPRLTSMSGGTAVTYNSNGQQMGTELGVTGYYTKADYTEIVRYAAANNMTVVPEIDMPGHTNAALHAIPQLNSAGSKPALKPGETTVPANGTPNVGYSSFDAASPATYEFAKQILTQIAAMTPGPYLHIGGDESHSTSDGDYTKMVDAITGEVNSLGRTVIGWNETARTALPKDNAVIQYWNGSTAAVADAVNSKGAKVILSPAANTYVPQKQDSRQAQGGTWACGGPCGLDRHYGWDPGKYIPGISETNVLGVESALWGEFIRRLPQAEYYSYPRLIATAEVGWTQQSQRDYTDFTGRLAAIGGRLTLQGVNFFPTADVPWQTAALGADRAVPAGSPAGATWTVTAPAAGELTGTITWNDGVKEDVTLTAARTASIPDMRGNGMFTAVSNRTFGTAGTYTATITLRPSGQAPVEAPLTLTVY